MSLEYKTSVAPSIAMVKQRMEQACKRAQRQPAAVTLLAVTKFHPVEAVYAAYAAGIRCFGENRVQEAESKFVEASETMQGSALHLLGHLQSNKIKKAVALFDCVQSVDSEPILLDIAKRAETMGKKIDILFELHTGEESKSGFKDEASLLHALAVASKIASLRPRGLMTMAPYTNDSDRVRHSFKTCAAVFLRARSECSLDDFDILSMGMSNDFEIAIEEGSTMIRVGTAIFGERPR